MNNYHYSGIISNVGPGESRGNIEMIRSLVMEHISGNCLILLALTMRGKHPKQVSVPCVE
jgi:hypothetical protein